MKTHSPAPWSVRATVNGVDGILYDARQKVVAVIKNTMGNHELNARLIRLAPEMLVFLYFVDFEKLEPEYQLKYQKLLEELGQ